MIDELFNYQTAASLILEQRPLEDDLNEAVAKLETLLIGTSQHNPVRTLYVSTLGTAYLRRFELFRREEDLDQAYTTFQNILNSLSSGRDPVLNLFSSVLQARYELKGS